MFSLGELYPRESSDDIRLIALCRSSYLGFVSNENLLKEITRQWDWDNVD